MSIAKCDGCGKEVLLLKNIDNGKWALIEIEPSPTGHVQVDEANQTYTFLPRTNKAANRADLRDRHVYTCPAMQEQADKAEEANTQKTVGTYNDKLLPLRPTEPPLVTPLRSKLAQAVGKNLAGESLVDKPSIAMQAYNEAQNLKGGPVTLPVVGPPIMPTQPYTFSLVDKITFNSPMSEVQGYISRWAEATFIHNELSIASHLLSEATALFAAAGGTVDGAREIVLTELRKPQRSEAQLPEKTADVAILALCMAGYLDFDLTVEVMHKMNKNKLRKWGRATGLGFVEHIREEAQTDGEEEK